MSGSVRPPAGELTLTKIAIFEPTYFTIDVSSMNELQLRSPHTQNTPVSPTLGGPPPRATPGGSCAGGRAVSDSARSLSRSAKSNFCRIPCGVGLSVHFGTLGPLLTYGTMFAE